MLESSTIAIVTSKTSVSILLVLELEALICDGLGTRIGVYPLSHDDSVIVTVCMLQSTLVHVA